MRFLKVWAPIPRLYTVYFIYNVRCFSLLFLCMYLILNISCTKLMVINGSKDDRGPLILNSTTIQYTNHYVYLGAHFVDNSSMVPVMRFQAEACRKQVIKFSAFLYRNSNMPFCLKKKVLEAALFSSMLYACESWLTDGLKAVNQHYMAAIKQLLGVRSTTPHVLCLLEAGLPDLIGTITKRRCNFMTAFVQRSSQDEPLSQVLELCRRENTDMYQRLTAAQSYFGDPVLHSLQKLKDDCHQKATTATRFQTYLSLNPSLTCHPVYTRISSAPDYPRIDFTRLRLSSHRLLVERGRWLRIPRERRVCACDRVSIQDELHVTLRCPRTDHIRDSYHINANSLCELFDDNRNELLLFCHDILSVFD